MKEDADVHINRKGLQAAVSRDNALLETILAALPMDGDRQQADRILEKVQDDLVLDYVRKTVTLDKKKISLEKMREMTK